MDPLDRFVDGCRNAGPRAGRTRVVAVDGPSGSGKTTLAPHLADRFGGCPVVRMDAIHPGWDGLDDAVPRLVEWVLEPLAAGRGARYRRFDWDRGAYAEWHEVPDSPFLVVEGVGSGARRCAPYLTGRVWPDAPAEIRFARAMARDGDGYLPHWERWAAQERDLFAADGTAERADLTVLT